MPVARPNSSDSRVIAHIDMDCFYVQVEQRKQPHLRGQPTAVVQYNDWKGGALIAVSYEARSYGVKRSMRGDDAKQVCPGIQLVQVPVARGKADLNVYRTAGSEVVSILARKGRCERASIDEVYLDLSETAQAMLVDTPPESLEAISEEALRSHVLGLEANASDNRDNVRNWLIRNDADCRDKLLACGALIVAELRLQVLNQTEFTCSAGIAHNKMLAKLASGMNKPAQQTIVPFSSVKTLLDPLPIKKMKQLGGKLGTSLQTDLGVNTVGDLLKFSEGKLQKRYGINTGTWLWNVARGISGEEVQGRLLPKSHGAGKTFPGPRALRTSAAVENWLKELCAELSARLHSDLEQNKRIARTLTLHATAFKVSDSGSFKKFPSKSCSLRYGVAKVQEDTIMLFQAALREYLAPCKVKSSDNQYEGWGITGLSISASRIVPVPSGTCSIMNYFYNQDHSPSSVQATNDKLIQEAVPFAPSENHLSGVGSDSDQLGREKESADAGKECSMIASDQKDEREVWKEEDVLVTGSIQDQNIYSLSSKQKDGFRKEKLISSVGAQSSLGLDQTKSNKESHGKEIACRVKLEEQKLKSPKEKEKSSILRFFHKHTPSSSKSEHVKFVQESKVSSSSDSQSGENEPRQNGPLAETICKMDIHSLSRDEHSSTWSYRMDEIDPAVLNELPLHIQEEVRAWLRPQKRANIMKRGSSIAQYFSPAKES